MEDDLIEEVGNFLDTLSEDVTNLIENHKVRLSSKMDSILEKLKRDFPGTDESLLRDALKNVFGTVFGNPFYYVRGLDWAQSLRFDLDW